MVPKLGTPRVVDVVGMGSTSRGAGSAPAAGGLADGLEATGAVLKPAAPDVRAVASGTPWSPSVEGTGAAGGTTVSIRIVLALLVLLGAYLRLANLGRLGIHADEDLSSLAVQAILAKGIPELPSGMIYLRGGAFLYFMAASAKLFGFSEFAMRLPAALFGIAAIPLGFSFGRALFGARVGVIVAALLAISFWDIELSRYARMYAPFSFFYMLTVLCLWRYRVQTENAAGGILCVLLAVATVSFHALGYTLAPAMFFPLLLRGPRAWLKPRQLVFPVVAAVVVSVFFFVWEGFVARLMSLPISGADARVAAETGAAVLPSLALAPALLDRFPAVFAVLAAALVGAAGLYAVRTRRGGVDAALLVAIGLCCALGIINGALLALVALAASQRSGLLGVRSPAARFAAGLVAASVAAWLVLTLVLDLVAPEFTGLAAIKAALRWSLLDFPHFFVFWGFAREWPLASIVAGVGALWAFDRAARRRAREDGRFVVDPAPAFLLLALATPLVMNGLFGTRYQLFRYDVPFDTFYFALVALGLLRWPDVVAAWRGNPAMPPLDIAARRAAHTPRVLGSRFAGGTALLAALVLAYDLNPVKGVLLVQRDYRNDAAPYRLFGLTRYADFKTPAAFVAAHAAPDDEIIVLDSREMFSYLGRADYWVRTAIYDTQTYRTGDTVRDLYVSTPLLMSVDALDAALSAPGKTKWLVASDAMLAETRAVGADVKRFIRSQAAHVVYVGRDGETKVYRFSTASTDAPNEPVAAAARSESRVRARPLY
jgi:4-amino-4-deoxy-L-arabinose transferase-like glycosyltransferase